MPTGNVVVAHPIIAQDVLDELDAASLEARITPQAISNSSAEIALATLTIGANQAQVNSVWSLNVRGIGSVTGTPTITFRARLDGIAGTVLANFGAITCSSGISNHPWEVDLLMSCLSTGGSGTVHATTVLRESLSVAGGSAPWTVINRMAGTGTVTFDTTAASAIVITGQYSAASSSNTISTRIVAGRQVS